MTLKILYNIYKYLNNKNRERLKALILRLDEGEFYSKYLRKIYIEYHGIEIGEGSYGWIFNEKNINPNTKIGKYCSIAPNVYIYNRNHPKEYVSTHPFFYNKSLGVINREVIEYKEKKIGNDVWIGQNVIILPSVNKIGDGAIIGAGAIVTKDVPEYAIVAGNPAKVISYRFSEEDMKFLKENKWWELSKEEIANMGNIMNDITKYKESVLKKRGHN